MASAHTRFNNVNNQATSDNATINADNDAIKFGAIDPDACNQVTQSLAYYQR